MQISFWKTCWCWCFFSYVFFSITLGQVFRAFEKRWMVLELVSIIVISMILWKMYVCIQPEKLIHCLCIVPQFTFVSSPVSVKKTCSSVTHETWFSVRKCYVYQIERVFHEQTYITFVSWKTSTLIILMLYAAPSSLRYLGCGTHCDVALLTPLWEL